MSFLLDFSNIVEVLYFSTTNIDYFKEYKFGEVFKDPEDPSISTIVIPVSKIVDFAVVLFDVVNKQSKMSMKKEEGKVWLFLDNSNQSKKDTGSSVNRQPENNKREWRSSII